MWPRCHQGLSSGCVRSALVRSSQQLQLAAPAFSENFSFGEEDDHRDWEPEQTVTTAPNPPKPPKSPKWPKARYSNAALTLMQAKHRSWNRNRKRKKRQNHETSWKMKHPLFEGCTVQALGSSCTLGQMPSMPCQQMQSLASESGLEDWTQILIWTFRKLSKNHNLCSICFFHFCISQALSHSRCFAPELRGTLDMVSNWENCEELRFAWFPWFAISEIFQSGKSKLAWIWSVCSDRRAPPSCNAQRGEPFAIFAEAERLQRFSQWVMIMWITWGFLYFI